MFATSLIHMTNYSERKSPRRGLVFEEAYLLAFASASLIRAAFPESLRK